MIMNTVKNVAAVAEVIMNIITTIIPMITNTVKNAVAVVAVIMSTTIITITNPIGQ